MADGDLLPGRRLLRYASEGAPRTFVLLAAVVAAWVAGFSGPAFLAAAAAGARWVLAAWGAALLVLAIVIARLAERRLVAGFRSSRWAEPRSVDGVARIRALVRLPLAMLAVSGASLGLLYA